ncbi:hypothetical protein BC826DRAFT_251176 [Russula brevipes]|nr:hypothetical protein BC826DRAFT_251176 [Russula brevipes]
MVEDWHTLAHVCHQWRSVVLASPRRLNLQLLCTEKTPVREMLEIWPTIPIVVMGEDPVLLDEDADYIITALDHHDRVLTLSIDGVPNSLFGKLAAVTQGPFTALTSLVLLAEKESAPVIPDSFLGGSAPHLQTLHLSGVPFPGLRGLLLSAGDLVNLELWDIPDSGYMSPVEMVTCLSALTSLETLELVFRSPRSRPDQASGSPPPLTRADLPSLTSLCFQGVSEYLEDFVTRIDASLLNEIDITFFNQLIFSIPQLPQFVSRTEKFKALRQADLVFHSDSVGVTLSPQAETENSPQLVLQISCSESDWQLSSQAQVESWFLPLLSDLEHLKIREHPTSRPSWQDDIENSQWLEVLTPFNAVTSLHLSKELAQHIAPVLRTRVMEVLPQLQDISVEELQPSGPVREAIEEFAAARQLSDHPVTING